jgi:hypothetical protein
VKPRRPWLGIDPLSLPAVQSAGDESGPRDKSCFVVSAALNRESIAKVRSSQGKIKMPTSLSDFCTKVAAQAPSNGAVFRIATNPDGSVQILRAQSSTSGVWSVLYPRVIYNVVNDTVLIGDGSIMSASTASALIAGLN